MSYTVTYKPSAEAALTAIWTDADDRAAVAAAADEIDTLLRRDPHVQGESRGGAERVLFVPPLGVLYEVDDGDRRVEVFKVWHFV